MKFLKDIWFRRIGDAISGGPLEAGPKTTNAWEQRTWLWHAAFYFLLVLALASSLADMGLYGRPQLAIIALTVLFGVWYWFMVLRHRLYGCRQAWPTLLYVAGAMVLWFSLTMLHPSYHMLLLILYAQIGGMLPIGWAIPSSVTLTTLIVVRGLIQESGSPFAWVLTGVLSTAFGVLFSLWIYSIIRQSRERQRLIEELESTREELAAEERRTGILEERGRLAREIHDTLAQGFISIVTHLESAEAELPEEASITRDHLSQARDTARENLSEARRLVAALRPEILDGSSLEEALQRLAERFSQENGISAETNVTGDRLQLPQEHQVTLYRAAQEALTNARKHSGACSVVLTLSYMEDLVLVDVQDDGVGFDPDSINGDGYGLKAMRERVRGLGGEILVESAPGEGTTLAVRVPADSREGE